MLRRMVVEAASSVRAFFLSEHKMAIKLIGEFDSVVVFPMKFLTANPNLNIRPIQPSSKLISVMTFIGFEPSDPKSQYANNE